MGVKVQAVLAQAEAVLAQAHSVLAQAQAVLAQPQAVLAQAQAELAWVQPRQPRAHGIRKGLNGLRTVAEIAARSPQTSGRLIAGILGRGGGGVQLPLALALPVPIPVPVAVPVAVPIVGPVPVPRRRARSPLLPRRGCQGRGGGRRGSRRRPWNELAQVGVVKGMFEPAVGAQVVTTCVCGVAKRALEAAGEMHVVVVPNVGHYLAAKLAAMQVVGHAMDPLKCEPHVPHF